MVTRLDRDQALDGRPLRLSGREKSSSVTTRRRLRSSPVGRDQRTHDVRNPVRHDPAIQHSRANLCQDFVPVEPAVSTDNYLRASACGCRLMGEAGPALPIVSSIAVDGYGHVHAEKVQGREEGAQRCGLACRASSGLPRGLGACRPRGAYRRCRQGQGHGACRHAG
jgi:hypothetical protein